MSALSIQPTYPIFTETDGLPLENGYIWIGAANLDPQGNPITVYWDAALTITAPQPIRTLNGYPSRSGTPARLYVNSDYSIRVQDSKGSLVYSAPAATERYNDIVISEVSASDVIFTPTGTNTFERSVESRLNDSVSIFNYIPPAEHAAIQARTSTYDCTADIETAIADCSYLIGSGGDFGFEKCIVFPQGTYHVKYIDVTNRRNVWLVSSGFVIILGVDSSVKNFVFGSTNYNPSNPSASTITPNCFLGGPGQWSFAAAPGTSYQYGLRLEQFYASRFEKVAAGTGYITVTDVNGATGSRVAAYLQLTYSNIFIDCSFSNPAAPPVGGKSIGLFMDSNNVNSNTFIRCNWQGATATPAPYVDTIGVRFSGLNNVWDNCDLSALDTAFIGNGDGHQFRNIYSEYVTTFWSGSVAGQAKGCTIQGGLIEIVNNGTAFNLLNCENTTIIGGHYLSAFAGTRTFIAQTDNYGLTVIQPNLVVGAFANFITGTYQGASSVNSPSVLQTNWLSFPPTQVASTNVNTLDDYEEGTWTPNKVSGTAFTSASGRYTKVGNLVTATFLVVFAVETNSAFAQISSFPFSASGGAAENNGLGVGYNTSAIPVGGTVSLTTMSFRQNGGVDVTCTQMSGATVTGTLTYTII